MAADSDLVAIRSTWSGRHVRPFVTYDDAGTVTQAMPPTGKTFAATQSHWFRLADGKIIEHWANRDDDPRPCSTASSAGSTPMPRLPGPDGPRQVPRATPGNGASR